MAVLKDPIGKCLQTRHYSVAFHLAAGKLGPTYVRKLLAEPAQPGCGSISMRPGVYRAGQWEDL
jgi:hypothetical protein